MLTQSQWQDAITEANFRVQLDHDFDIDTFTGFLPCRLDGELTGFEYYPSQLSAVDVRQLDLPAATNFCVALRIGGRPSELVSALAASSALASASGGTLVDPQEDERYASQDVIKWARDQIAHL